MAEESLYFAARATDASPGDAADVAEVVDSPFSPLRPTRLHVEVGEESATSSSSPRFLTQPNDASETLNLADVQEDQDDDGDGDSKASVDELEELNQSFSLASLDRLQILVKLEDDTDEAVLDKESNQVWFDLADWDESTQLPKIPEDWVAPRRSTKHGEPEFSSVDNPGEWPDFTFRPHFNMVNKKRGKYLYHHTATGCTPVPLDDKGTRSMNGWNFNYKRWKQTSNIHLESVKLPTKSKKSLFSSCH